MARSSLLAPLAFAAGLALALSGACSVAPRGLCDADADCLAGLSCQGGVCVGCEGDAGCRAWEACTDRRCQLRAGRCADDAACQAWERCDGAHACVLRPGRGDAAGAGCEAWQACQATDCVARPGRCGGDADCAAGQACTAGNACVATAFDPGAVVLWGTFTAGSTCAGAVAPLDAPAAALTGFGCGRAGPAWLSPAGDLVYADVAGGALRRFRHDPMAWDPLLALWAYPVTPAANDEVALAAAPCAGRPWTAWALQAGTGAVRYACAAGGSWDWFDAAGARVLAGGRAFAWTAGGLALATPGTGPFDAAAAVVVDASGGSVPVSGLPAGALLAVRAGGEAFRLALRVDAGGGNTRDERWLVAADGAAALEGEVAPAPAGFAEAGAPVLDAAGVLFSPGALGGVAVVVRRPLLPGLAVTAYSAAAAPAGADDLRARPFLPWVLLDGGAQLVTGP
jgi:hypothetical protein